MRQFLYGNRSLRAFGFLNEPLNDYVVYVGLVAALLAAHLSEPALGGAGADLLKVARRSSYH